jgi:hypothetical protein
MFLLFLCPGTILAPSCRTSCQVTSSPPPSSRSVGAVSSHPFSRSTTAPTPSYAAFPAPSPSESGPGTRSSPSAASRLARPRTPRLAARVAVANRRVCTQAVLPPPSGSRFHYYYSKCLLIFSADMYIIIWICYGTHTVTALYSFHANYSEILRQGLSRRYRFFAEQVGAF